MAACPRSPSATAPALALAIGGSHGVEPGPRGDGDAGDARQQRRRPHRHLHPIPRVDPRSIAKRGGQGGARCLRDGATDIVLLNEHEGTNFSTGQPIGGSLSVYYNQGGDHVALSNPGYLQRVGIPVHFLTTAKTAGNRTNERARILFRSLAGLRSTAASRHRQRDERGSAQANERHVTSPHDDPVSDFNGSAFPILADACFSANRQNWGKTLFPQH